MNGPERPRVLAGKWLAGAGLLLVLGLGACTQTESDLASQGEAVFIRCGSCHSVTERINKVGPHLVGLFGRPSGAVADFRYSEPMRRAGRVWNEETLRAFLADPRGTIPGNRMSFAGIRDTQDLEALIAYLAQATAEN